MRRSTRSIAGITRDTAGRVRHAGRERYGMRDEEEGGGQAGGAPRFVHQQSFLQQAARNRLTQPPTETDLQIQDLCDWKFLAILDL